MSDERWVRRMIGFGLPGVAPMMVLAPGIFWRTTPPGTTGIPPANRPWWRPCPPLASMDLARWNTSANITKPGTCSVSFSSIMHHRCHGPPVRARQHIPAAIGDGAMLGSGAGGTVFRLLLFGAAGHPRRGRRTVRETILEPEQVFEREQEQSRPGVFGTFGSWARSSPRTYPAFGRESRRTPNRSRAGDRLPCTLKPVSWDWEPAHGKNFHRHMTTNVRLRRQEFEAQETPYRKPFAARFSVSTFRFMQARKPIFAGPLEARLHATADEYCARRGFGLRAFGAAAAGDAEFVPSLARGRSPTLETVDAVLAAMDMAPAGPAFHAEVEAFLAVTGTKRSVLGRGATNNPSFVAHLEQGTSPTLRTVHKVRAWMAAHARPAEARAIRRLAGPMPEFLSDAPRRRSHGSSGASIRPNKSAGVNGRPEDDGALYFDTNPRPPCSGSPRAPWSATARRAAAPCTAACRRGWCATGAKTWRTGRRSAGSHREAGGDLPGRASRGCGIQRHSMTCGACLFEPLRRAPAGRPPNPDREKKR